jgi:hypothetical protein
LHRGVFEGEIANDQPVKILILGESHHWSKEDWVTAKDETEAQAQERRKKKAETYRTEDVMKRYFENYESFGNREQAYRFFENIVRSFGFDPENRTNFWNRVWFGNYIDELCGVRDSKAAKLLGKPGKREALNQKLFEFIEANEIDIVFCFSRKVYNKLPPLELAGDKETKGDKTDSHRLNECFYNAGQRKCVPVRLSKPVVVYGLKHPYQGFSYRRYQNQIAKLIQKHNLLF